MSSGCFKTGQYLHGMKSAGHKDILSNGPLVLKVISSVLHISTTCVQHILLDAYMLSLRTVKVLCSWVSPALTTVRLPCVETLVPVLSWAAHSRNYRYRSGPWQDPDHCVVDEFCRWSLSSFRAGEESNFSVLLFLSCADTFWRHWVLSSMKACSCFTDPCSSSITNSIEAKTWFWLCTIFW